VLISEDQLGKAFDELDDAMKLIRPHVKDEAQLKAIQKKLLLAIVSLVPEAGAMTQKKA